MGVVIFLNAIQVVYESDVGSACRWENSQSACDQEEGWLLVMNWIYLGLYSVELSVRAYVYRWQILFNPWEAFDAAIVLIGIVSEALGRLLPSTGILRLFRLARILRAVHFVKLPKELHIMVHGFISASVAIVFGCALVFLMLTLWSVVAMAVLNEPNHDAGILIHYQSLGCDWAPDAWISVMHSIFTFTQLLIMGETWECNAIPLIERNPWTMILFMAVFFTVILGMTNLILAVIVEKALAAHNEAVADAAKARNREKKHAIKRFIGLCAGMDKDGSGSLTIQELSEGYRTNKQFRDTMDILDIAFEELELFFSMMDADKSGDVSYEEFGNFLSKMMTESQKTMLSFTKHQVAETQAMVTAILERISSPGFVGLGCELSVAPTASEMCPQQEVGLSAEAVLAKPSSVAWMEEMLVMQIRESIQGRVAELCSLLEEQASASEKGWQELSSPSPTREPEVKTGNRGQVSLSAVLDGLRGMETRLEARIVSMCEQLTSNIMSRNAEIPPAGVKFLCSPDTARSGFDACRSTLTRRV
jgi:voltage-gated sodium channel